MVTRKVLVVDDDKMIHTLLKGALEKHGFRIHSAYDTVQGSMVARQLKPSLIVLDISMPGGGGYEAFRRLQSLATTAQIPILVYSALDMGKIQEEIPPGAGVAHLRKPSAPEEILAAVQQLVDHH